MNFLKPFFIPQFAALAALLLLYPSAAIAADNKLPHSRSLYISDTVNCSRSWPSLELFLPVAFIRNSSRQLEYRTHFLRSLMLFWPFHISRTSLLILYDGEKAQSHAQDLSWLRSNLSTVSGRIPGGVRVVGSPPSAYYHDRGHDRQQLMVKYIELLIYRYINVYNVPCGIYSRCFGRTTTPPPSMWASATRTRFLCSMWTGRIFSWMASLSYMAV